MQEYENNQPSGLSCCGGSVDEVLVLTAQILFTVCVLLQLTCNKTDGIGQLQKVTVIQGLKNFAVENGSVSIIFHDHELMLQYENKISANGDM